MKGQFCRMIIVMLLGIALIVMFFTQYKLNKNNTEFEKSYASSLFIRTCFTPDEPCDRFIVEQIVSAKETIDVQAYRFTNKSIADAIFFAKNRGVKIRLILDKTAKPEMQYFFSKGISPTIDAQVHIAHNKVMIIDNRVVITGSFNFTENALKNAENVLIINSDDIASTYENNFRKRLSQSRYPLNLRIDN